MRTSKWLGTIALMGAVLGAFHHTMQSAPVDDWQTIADFRIVEGLHATGQAITTDPTGAILYSAGGARVRNENGEEIGAAIVVRKLPGFDWEVIDQFEGPRNQVSYTSVAVDPNSGTIYAAGSIGPGETRQWLVRSSMDGGETWQTVDLYAPAGGQFTWCAALAVDDEGSVYAAGSTLTGPRTADWIWIVRKGTLQANGSINWSNVDTGPGNMHAITYHFGSGTLFAAGRNGSSATKDDELWSIRRSRDKGLTWETVGGFKLKGPVSGALIFGLHATGAQSIYAVGYMFRYNAPWYWVVRGSHDNGNTWATLDLFTEEQKSWKARAVVTGQDGTLYVGGEEGETTWLIRKLVPGSSSWEISDLREAAPDRSHTIFRGLTTDASGTVYAAGAYNNQGGRWLIRALSHSRGGLAGIVFAEGNPVEQALITLAGGLATETDSQGQFSFPSLPVGSYSVTASAPGYYEQTLEAEVMENQTTFLEFSLAPLPTYTVWGFVLDASNGQPIAGALVSMVDFGLAVETGADGAYLLSGVPEGDHQVNVSADGYETAAYVLTVTADTEGSFALNPLPAFGLVSVTSITFRAHGQHVTVQMTVSSGGEPVAGAQVFYHVLRNGGLYHSGSLVTDAQGVGQVTLQRAPSGTYTSVVEDVIAGDLVWDGETPENSFTKP